MSADTRRPVVVVTGTAKKGIAYGVARKLVQTGRFQVLTADISAEGESVANELGAMFRQFDITDWNSVASLAGTAASIAPVHAVFNFAGFPIYEERHGLLRLEETQMRQSIDRNTLGPQFLAKHFLNVMEGTKEAPRLFVQGSSINGHRHYGQPCYSASELAQVGFGIGATYDFGSRWVSYIPIIMGSVDTPSTSNEGRDFGGAISRSVPMGGEVATPDEIGDILVALATIPAFRLLHSSPLFVDGGQHLCEPGELIRAK